MSKKILFVDDEADLLMVLSIRLKKTGYEVFEAIDGQGALDQARLIMPDLIVLDVFLPVMNGDEVAKILKSDEKLKSIPIILISADSKTLQERARASGADDYLAKPFASGALVSMVNKYIPL
ncbi:MAG: response regulator [Candidatus Omnitrophota bacterium]